MTTHVTNQEDATIGLHEFVRIVDEGSVSGAARALGVPRASLSRRLSALEGRLGVRLLHRTTRSQSLTRAGDELYDRARRIVAAAHEAEEAVRRVDEVPRGLLRVSLPPSFGSRGNVGRRLLMDFLDLHPEVQLEAIATSRHVDLVGEGFDVALRAGTLRDPTLFARRLWRNWAIAVASPAYLERRGAPQRPEELIEHSCLIGFEEGERPQRSWPLRDGGRVPVRGRLASNELTVRFEAALGGHGIALVPELLARGHLEAGRLVEVLPQHVGIYEGLSLVYADREFLEPKVRAFVDHAVEVMAELEAELAEMARRPCPEESP